MNAHAILLKEEGSNTFSSETITPWYARKKMIKVMLWGISVVLNCICGWPSPFHQFGLLVVLASCMKHYVVSEPKVSSSSPGYRLPNEVYYLTCVSPLVNSALPCARGSNLHWELIGRSSQGLRPSLRFPPWSLSNIHEKH
jgi:hypothetical protein